MFCTSCGAKLSDDALFCTSCGKKVASQPAQNTPAQPEVEKPVIEQPAAPVVEEPKVEEPAVEAPVVEEPKVEQPVAPAVEEPVAQPVIAQPIVEQPIVAQPAAPNATASPKKFSGLILVTFFLSLLLIAGSIITPIISDITNIPLIKTAINVAGIENDIDDARDDLDKNLDNVKEALEINEDDLSKKEKGIVEDFIDETQKLNDRFSLINFRKFFAVSHELGEELSDYRDFDLDLEELDEIAEILDFVIIGIAAAFLLPLIFTLLGGLLKKKGFTITALVFMVLVQFVLSGIVWVILSLIVYITQAVLCGKYQKAKQAAV